MSVLNARTTNDAVHLAARWAVWGTNLPALIQGIGSRRVRRNPYGQLSIEWRWFTGPIYLVRENKSPLHSPWSLSRYLVTTLVTNTPVEPKNFPSNQIQICATHTDLLCAMREELSL